MEIVQNVQLALILSIILVSNVLLMDVLFAMWEIVQVVMMDFIWLMGTALIVPMRV